MGSHFEYEKTVPNFTGGRELTLTVVERDGGIGIGLTLIGEDNADQRMCFIDPAEGERVVRALNAVIARAKAKEPRS